MLGGYNTYDPFAKQSFSEEQLHKLQSLFGTGNSFGSAFKSSDWKASGPSKASTSSQKAPHWNSLDEMMRDLRSLPKKHPKVAGPPLDPETRKKQINDELDILRGRVPTPPGYTVNPARAKALMSELKSLS